MVRAILLLIRMVNKMIKNSDWQWVKIGTSLCKVPSEDICRADLARIDRSIQGFIIKDADGNKVQFYDFDTAFEYSNKNGGFMYYTLVDPQKEILGVKRNANAMQTECERRALHNKERQEN